MNSRHETKSWLTDAWALRVDDYPSVVRAAPDRLMIAVGTVSGDLFLIDVRSGAVITRRSVQQGSAPCVAWTRSGSVLATSGRDGVVALHDAAGSPLGSFAGPWGMVEHLTPLHQGERLAVASGRGVWITDLQGTILGEVSVPEGPIGAVASSPRGGQLAVAHPGAVTLLSLRRGMVEKLLPCAGNPISIAWSPGETILACATDDQLVRFYRLAGGRDAEISRFPSKPRALSWSADGERLAVGGAAPVSVWSFEDGGPVGIPPLQLRGHHALCTTVVFHPELPLLASGGDDQRVLLWSPTEDTDQRGTGLLEDTVTALVWVLRGELLLGADALGTLRAWRLRRG